ncbi:unnamed protein product [Lymnaea stagnalis]|uniref:SWI/SNF-related matrix-associated actin-dependent regulator of chromatin subfamily A-like protein 1 n=1 Tax=Lymnaea stagnalis TaxID=6523 RepID=A0AAV2H3E9_LYMST
MSSQDLTKEQRQRIEENKLRALARRAEKVSPVKQIQNEAKPNGFSVVTSFPENNNIEMKLKIETNREKALKKNKMQISIGVKEQPKTAIQGGNFNSQSVVRNINMKVVNEQDTSVRISIKGKTNETKHPSQNYFSNKDSNFGAIDQLNISPNDRDDWATKEMSASMIPKDAFYNSTQKMKGTCILTDNRMFYVDVGYSAPLINFFKQMKTKIYDSTKKVWSFKLEEYNAFMKGVSQFKPEIDIEGLPPWILQTFGSSTSENSIVSEADLKCVDDVLVQTLLPFQKHGVNVAIHRQGRLLIADDMGLGKTLQAICIASYYRNEWPLLVVCPSSVRFDWSQQICKWLPSVPIGEINVVETGKRSAISGLVNIISYDLLSKKTVELNEKRFKVIIMDESHFLKNAKTVRTRAAMPLLKSAKRVLLLSGTPALSRPSELFCQIVGVCPDIVKFHNFGLRYCNAKQVN